MSGAPQTPDDPLWARAAEWIAEGTARRERQPGGRPDLGLLGVPAHLTSLSPTAAHTTPAAVRAVLTRYSTWDWSERADLRDLWAVDLGDIDDPDSPAGERRTAAAVAGWPGRLLIALGGDNSITFAVARGSRADGLITLDAHHDLRDGKSNGSPVQRLIEAGLDGRRVAQVGIADFANSPQYAARAREYGITVITRADVQRRGIADAMAEALAIAGAGPRGRVHVDLDVDVCDRAAAPACPASAPGGLSAWELRRAARLAAADRRVVSLDLTEVDAEADATDGRTVRLVALCVLEAAVGLLDRLHR